VISVYHRSSAWSRDAPRSCGAALVPLPPALRLARSGGDVFGRDEPPGELDLCYAVGEDRTPFDGLLHMRQDRGYGVGQTLGDLLATVASREALHPLFGIFPRSAAADQMGRLIAGGGGLWQHEKALAQPAPQLLARVVPEVRAELVEILTALRGTGDIDHDARQGLIPVPGEEQADTVVLVSFDVAEIGPLGGPVQLRLAGVIHGKPIVAHDGGPQAEPDAARLAALSRPARRPRRFRPAANSRYSTPRQRRGNSTPQSATRAAGPAVIPARAALRSCRPGAEGGRGVGVGRVEEHLSGVQVGQRPADVLAHPVAQFIADGHQVALTMMAQSRGAPSSTASSAKAGGSHGDPESLPKRGHGIARAAPQAGRV